MRSLLFSLLGLLTFSQCAFQDEEIVSPGASESAEFSFDDGFDFKTSKVCQITIHSSAPFSKYQISYIDNGQEIIIASLGNKGKAVSIDLTIPTYLESIVVTEQRIAGESQKTVNIADLDRQEVYFSEKSLLSTSGLANDCVDRLYAVNNQGGFWSINTSNADYEETQLPNLRGGGSIACALDQENQLMYYNVGRTLYAYQTQTGEFRSVFTSNPYNGSYPRLAYRDGFFYMGNGSSMYVVDASTNQVVNSYRIQGIVNTASGGDLAFTSDGTLYLSCFSGLYRFTAFNESTAQVERVSAENFPFQLTSMAIDRKDRIFVATNDTNSNLLEMDPADGSYRIVKTYNHKINDLTSWRCEAEDLDQTDSDGDGTPDAFDDHPNDPDAAFDVFTPSEIGFGSLAFEDLWPQKGDYDFNDLVVNYRFTNVLNSDNKSVRLEITLKLMAVGASFRNGFGLVLPIDASGVRQVSGYEVTKNIVNLNGKGLEAGHGQSTVIIAFDDARDLMGGSSIVNTNVKSNYVNPKEINLTVEFSKLLDPSELANPPFNPFIFIDGDRSRELHLKDQTPTAKANEALFQSADDMSDPEQNQYYVSENNVPWAIDIIHNFRYPREKVRIDNGYQHFVNWGSSRGTLYRDWYKDNNGYRNDSKLYFFEQFAN